VPEAQSELGPLVLPEGALTSATQAFDPAASEQRGWRVVGWTGEDKTRHCC